MTVRCGKCETPLVLGERFCGSCGQPADAAAPPAAPTGGAPFVPPPSTVSAPATAPLSTVPGTLSAGAPPSAPPSGPPGAAPSAVPTGVGPRGVLADGQRVQQQMQTSVAEVVLAKGELIKATYPVTRIHRPLGWVEAYLIITDARVIYRAQASNRFSRSVTASEIHMADVRGAAVTASRGLTPLASASMIFLALIGLMATFLFPPLILLFAIVIGLIAWLGRRSELFFEILSQVSGSSADHASPIRIASGIRLDGTGILRGLWALLMSPLMAILRLAGLLDSSSIALSGQEVTGENRRALDEAIRMYDEIGALILDIKSSGVLADERL